MPKPPSEGSSEGSSTRGPIEALRRELGVFGATMMGLGAIVGTGIFVSVGIAAGIAGPAVVVAIAIAAGVASCNALSSAQLAASHPVSGGTYEYGYEYLRPSVGFTAGWMFLCAKSASAATAALGVGGYLLHALGESEPGRWAVTAVGGGVVVAVTLVVASGIRLSNVANVAIVSVTLLSLLIFVLAGLPLAWARGAENLGRFAGTQAADAFWPALLQGTALMFVAYTGYGRIATLGEEVREPRRTIPRAIILTLLVSMALYLAVGAVAVAAVGAAALGGSTGTEAAPLEVVARELAWPGAAYVLAVGAVTAMLGVLLNLILGLSRVLLAMGRRRDMPSVVGRLNRERTTPLAAVVVSGGIVLALALLGDVKTTWSFSAFTVLLYYAITNLAALALPARHRLYPRWISVLGLLACLFLAFWVDRPIWLAGSGLLLLGLAWHGVARHLGREGRDGGAREGDR